MKVLLLTSEEQADSYSELYVGIHKRIGSMDMRRLGEQQQNSLRSYFADHIDVSKFDRIVIHLPFNVLHPQVRFLEKLENLIFIQTAIFLGKKTASESAKSQHLRKQIKFFNRMPWARIILTGYQATLIFQREGLDAWSINKGYNSNHFSGKNKKRSIPLLLIDNADEVAPPEFMRLEKTLKKHFPRLVVEENTVKPNVSQMPEAQIVVCADFQRGEYSGKIFRAMACGCVVAAFDQGNEEGLFHSLEDMQNIVLFEDEAMLLKKIARLKKDPELLKRIAKSGQELAVRQHKHIDLGDKMAAYIITSLRKKTDYRLGITAFGLRF